MFFCCQIVSSPFARNNFASIHPRVVCQSILDNTFISRAYADDNLTWLEKSMCEGRGSKYKKKVVNSNRVHLDVSAFLEQEIDYENDVRGAQTCL